MLSVSSRDYYAPVFIRHDDGKPVGWRLARHTDETCVQEVTNVHHFNYTIPVVRNNTSDRMTFEYTEGGGIKPSPRTLRVFGNEDLRLVISKLARLRVWVEDSYTFKPVENVVGDEIASLGMSVQI